MYIKQLEDYLATTENDVNSYHWIMVDYQVVFCELLTIFFC